MRLVAWNIRAGGGTRWEGIADQLKRWGADVVGLSEFRGTDPSLHLSKVLSAAGLEYQVTNVDTSQPRRNSLLLASRWPLRRIRLRRAPGEPGRWLLAEVLAERAFTLAVMHAPNFVTGRKPAYLKAVEQIAASWRRGPAAFMGDTNCGWPGLDEERPVFNRETEQWLNSLATLGWRDAFRLHHPEERCYTWYSPNGGNGFRLDEAFLNRGLLPRLKAARYEWGSSSNGDVIRRDQLSDHAALLVDLA